MNEMMLQANPDFYKIVVDSIKDYAVFTTDAQGVVTSWSAGAEKVLLYMANEIIGTSADILYTPEDIEQHAPALEMGTALREGKGIDERFHVKKGGKRFWGSGLVFPLFNEAGQHMGFSKIMRNISDEEQAQANLREEQELAQTIVSTYNESVVILNSQLEVVNATPEFIRFFSLNKTDITGKLLFEILDGGVNLAELRAVLDEIVKEHRFHHDYEVSFEHPQRGARSLLVKPRRIYQPPNLLFSLEFADQTDDRAIMQEKDIFISVASHEIRTPVSVIKAYGQLLDRELQEAKPIIKKAVDKINEQSNFLNSLISALLDTSKITTGKLLLDKEVFNLCSLVKEQVESFGLTVAHHKIILQNEADSMVLADRVRTGSVVTNLLSNAVKYSPKANEVMVSVDVSEMEVKVSVQDFGLGIPQQDQHKLFQRFGRTESIKKTRIPGTGLGLHLAAEIIKMQGGTINFITEVGQGSTFYFTLPLYDK
ncbi:PAS domain S-box protein [Mucilaginibacter sp. Bleaf8]|uniref:sensor histidine kinase n=1 Tax=Mucilaginibacter sp. Bleaf8 TaxID=2834430 RepID=UPI001BCAEE77|nr:PAS domain-containing sensor histidine kinase [Mucilaginibacter sp. Bleaf8]MBS7563741.1 PAS domain S-box protein [Mucilaginibacter sp. Bleaf8]